MPKRRGRAKSLDHQPTSSAPCELNTTRIDEVLRALPSYFLRHWPERSVGFRQMLQTYDSLAGWGRTRFQIVDGKLYYPNLKHNTFGCVLRRTPILAWALLQTLDRHNISDVDIPVNCRDTPGTPINQRLMRSSGSPPLSFSYTTAAGYADIPLPDFTYWVSSLISADFFARPASAHAGSNAPNFPCAVLHRDYHTRIWCLGKPGLHPPSSQQRMRAAIIHLGTVRGIQGPLSGRKTLTSGTGAHYRSNEIK